MPISQTTEMELVALARYAQGKQCALEIGTNQGASAVRIAKALGPDGVLFCVDPWPTVHNRLNPCRAICERSFRREGVSSRIRICPATTSEVEDQLPANLDFAFIDGDHSWQGISTDWRIVAPRLQHEGIVCLHDAVTLPEERWRRLDTVSYYDYIISKDDSFEGVEIIHSMVVLRKR